MKAKTELRGYTALHTAVLRGREEAVELLCRSMNEEIGEMKEKEEIVNMTDEAGYTALMIAAQYQMEKREIWKPILACQGLRLDIVNHRGNTVFHLVMYYEGWISRESAGQYCPTFLKHLLELCGCNLPSSAIITSASHRIPDEIITQLALSHLTNSRRFTSSTTFTSKNDKHHTPLHKSLGLRDISTTMPALYNSDPPTSNAMPLPPPCEMIPIQFSRLLISAGADIEAIDMQGQNALHRACTLPDDMSTVKLLRECFFSRYQRRQRRSQSSLRAWSTYTCSLDFFGRTPLHLAARSGNCEAVDILLDPTYNLLASTLVEIKDYNDKTVLHFLASRPQRFETDEDIKIQIVETILKIAGEMTPLLLWCIGERQVTLADKQANIEGYKKLAKDLKTKRKQTTCNLLGLALRLENYDMVVDLINRGACITHKMRRKALEDDLLKRERSQHMKREQLEHTQFRKKKVDDNEDTDNEHTSKELKRGCLQGLFNIRKKQVERSIDHRRKQQQEDEPSLKQIRELDNIRENHQGRTTDQPTSEDLLDREDIMYAISALLLNQHMGSPITLGILGGAGMGKSSMMLQVEHSLLLKAARETVSLALPSNVQNKKVENLFIGARKQSRKSKKNAKNIFYELKEVIQKLEPERHRRGHRLPPPQVITHLGTDEKRAFVGEDLLRKIWNFLNSKFRNKGLMIETLEQQVNKYISSFDMETTWIIKRLALANDGEKNAPGLMTIRYDAWQYENKDEAWAGLAVAILKEMEASMTKSRLLWSSWRNSYRKNPSGVTVQLGMPLVIGAILVGVVAWVIYELLSLPTVPAFLQPFKYASLPIGVLAATWQAIQKAASYLKPISEQFVEKTKVLHDKHLGKLGYQHQVIDDITFLKKQMCSSMSWASIFFWTLVASTLNTSSVATASSSSASSNIEATDILKYTPPRENFRIIVFIDNLDRQKEELFTPLNMILKSCDINAVVAIDKESVEDVIERSLQDGGKPSDDNDDDEMQKRSATQMETLLRQLIQIPVVLPEPDLYALTNIFLEKHLNDFEKRKMIKRGKRENSESKSSIVTNNTTEFKNHDLKHESIGKCEISNYVESTLGEIDNNIVESKIHDPEHESVIGHIREVGPSNLVHDPGVETCEIKKQDINEEDQHSVQIRISKYQQPRGFVNSEYHKKEEIITKRTDERNFNEAWLEMNVNVLDTNYTRGEIEIFKHLANHTYGYYRSPRAWKSFLNYHRLVRSLITYKYQEIVIKAWKRQLVIWVFMCWQWKHQMNEIFKKWDKLSSKPKPLRELLLEDKLLLEAQLVEAWNGKELPSLLLMEKEYQFLWDPINMIYPSLKQIVEMNMKKKHKEAISGENENWTRIIACLEIGKFDVTMQAIQAFQKYRFDCEAIFLSLNFDGTTN